MLNKQSRTKHICLLAVFLACFGSVAKAQTTILNTPSTDVQATGTTYVETDFIGHLTKFDKGGFQSYGLRLVYGARKRVEVGANLFYNRAAETTQAVELQPNAKWQFYQNEDKGLALAAGGVLILPLPRRQKSDTLGLVYVTASKKVRAAYGPRLTGGAYRTVGSKTVTGDRNGGIFGYEQPVNRRLTLYSDWYTGKNRFGYASAGFGSPLSKKSVLYVAYSFGNAGRGNNALAVYYGWTF